MDQWKLQFVAVTFCALAQTSEGLWSNVEEKKELSKDSQGELLDIGLTNAVNTLMKRSKALRFYGLMGKRSDTKKPFKVNRRTKSDSFVGLMGRSISSGESLSRTHPSVTTTAFDVLEKSHEEGSQEEWVQIMY